MRVLLPLLVSGCTVSRSTPIIPTGTGPVDTDEPATPEPSAFLMSYFETDDCRDATKIVPAQGEDGHVAASILVPPVTPWVAESIYVGLSNEADDVVTCNAEQAHTIYVWLLDDGESLPADAEPLLTIEEGPEFLDGAPARIIAHELLEPIVVEEGQRLAIGLKMAGVWPDVSCIAACGDDWNPGRDHWSNSATRPYDWASLGSFGVESHLWMFALGEPINLPE